MENVIYVAALHDWFDYLATGATLLFSAIAVIIAVSTANRQNRIALFKERDICYCYIRALYYSTKAAIDVLSNSDIGGDSSKHKHVLEIRYLTSFTCTTIQKDTNADYLYLSQLIQYSDKENLSRAKRLFRLNIHSIEVINKFIAYDSFLIRSITSEITGIKSDFPLDVQLVVVKRFFEEHDFEGVLTKMAKQTTMNLKRRLRKSEL